MIPNHSLDKTAAGASDQGANDQSLERLLTVLKRYCLSLTKSDWDAEDLAQDAWLKAMNHLHSFGHANLEAYLLRIAKNTWVDHLRRRKLSSRMMNSGQPKVTLPDQGSFEIESALYAIVKHLPPLQRAVFLLRDVFGYSIAEAAVRLKTSEGAIKSALHRARQSLGAVKEELEQGSNTLTEDEGLKTYLRILVSAYQTGDLVNMVELVQLNQMEPSMAIGIVHHRKLHHSLSSRRRINANRPSSSQIRMAA
jgi:RNA polymerase sigma factor (sigma-70 family)